MQLQMKSSGLCNKKIGYFYKAIAFFLLPCLWAPGPHTRDILDIVWRLRKEQEIILNLPERRTILRAFYLARYTLVEL